MKILLSRKSCWPAALFILVSATAAFSQADQAQPSPQAPPAINESVPPASNAYALGPDSLPQKSSPAGKTFSFELKDSRIFPGTVRTITVYVPAAYKADKPACVYVGLDGLGFNAPTVFDNLIAQRAMPVTIAIGLAPGTVESSSRPENPRFDRSYEFDSLTDRLARFILDEVLPAVEQQRTPDGLPVRLSDNPNDRAIGGGSTGGIGAFNVAWQRPDAFRRVFTAVGTFVGMRGGEQFYVLVRKTEPKPIRIFMQDGVHDEWLGGPEMGDWWMSNQTMNRALEFAGYDVRHVWGTGTHDGSQASALFPDAMRWLWRDWPAPIQARPSSNPVLQAILSPPDDWRVVATGCNSIADLAANAEGQVFYRAANPERITPIEAEGQPAHCQAALNPTAFSFGPQGKLYTVLPQGGLQVTADPSRPDAAQTLSPGLAIAAFTVQHDGNVYAVTRASAAGSDLWLLPAGGNPVRLDEGLKDASGVALSPDGLWLMVAQRASPSGISYRVRSDATVDARAPFYHFDVPGGEDASGASQIAMDQDGRAYVATSLGVQVFDHNGRVTAILPLPGNAPATSLCFGGPHFDVLYVAGSANVYKRKLRVAGVPSWAQQIQLPPWGAG